MFGMPLLLDWIAADSNRLAMKPTKPTVPIVLPVRASASIDLMNPHDRLVRSRRGLVSQVRRSRLRPRHHSHVFLTQQDG